MATEEEIRSAKINRLAAQLEGPTAVEDSEALIKYIDELCFAFTMERIVSDPPWCMPYAVFTKKIKDRITTRDGWAIYQPPCNPTDFIIRALVKADVIREVTFTQYRFLHDRENVPGYAMVTSGMDFDVTTANGRPYVAYCGEHIDKVIHELQRLSPSDNFEDILGNKDVWLLIEYLTLDWLIDIRVAQWERNDGNRIFTTQDSLLVYRDVVLQRLKWSLDDVPRAIYEDWCQMIDRLGEERVLQLTKDDPKFVGCGVRPGVEIYNRLYELRSNMENQLVMFEEWERSND